MKLSVTEELLWNIYNFIEEVHKGFDLFAPRTMRDAISPDLFRLKREYIRKRSRDDFRQLIYYLKKKGYVKANLVGSTRGIMLTPKGAAKVLTIKWKSKQKEKRIDGKILMVMFDIPEKQRALRELLRDALLYLGYEPFQKSVWLCPYDVEKETEEVIRGYDIGKYTKVFLIEKVPL